MEKSFAFVCSFLNSQGKLLQQAKMVVAIPGVDTREEAKAKLLANLETNWPDERATDIEILDIDIIKRPLIQLAS